MANILLYSTEYCSYCTNAKRLLDRKGVTYIEVRVDHRPDLREEMVHKSGRQTVPQIFINGQAIGGYDDLYALEKEGKLDTLLQG